MIQHFCTSVKRTLILKGCANNKGVLFVYIDGFTVCVILIIRKETREQQITLFQKVLDRKLVRLSCSISTSEIFNQPLLVGYLFWNATAARPPHVLLELISENENPYEGVFCALEGVNKIINFSHSRDESMDGCC